MDVVEYLEKFIGRPYIWAGDGTSPKFGGFDCSGLILEGLWAFGIYTGPDTNAEGIRKYLKGVGSEVKKASIQRGDIIFFGSGMATHTAIAVSDRLMLEAGGGTSGCVDERTSTGFVRIRPISRRKDFLTAMRV